MSDKTPRTKPFDFENCRTVEPMEIVMREVDRMFSWGEDDETKQQKEPTP